MPNNPVLPRSFTLLAMIKYANAITASPIACLTGERSLKVVHLLNEYGFTNLLNMKKGLSKWAQKGYPIKGESFIQEKSCCGEHSHFK